jgi:hypothetical protein
VKFGIPSRKIDPVTVGEFVSRSRRERDHVGTLAKALDSRGIAKAERFVTSDRNSLVYLRLDCFLIEVWRCTCDVNESFSTDVFGGIVENLGGERGFVPHVQPKMTVGDLEIVARGNTTQVRQIVRQCVANPSFVASAVSALRNDTYDIDIGVGIFAVPLKAECSRGDTLHPSFSIDDEDDGKVERFGDHGGTGSVTVVQPHHSLYDADVAVAPGVVPPKPVFSLKPAVESS